MFFFPKFMFRREIKKHINRPLDINEILSRDNDTNLVVDTYEYFMRQSNWEIDERFNDTVKNFLLCIIYDGEIGNGGLSQFLANSNGKYAHQVADALHVIGAYDSEKILRKSFTYFNDGVVPQDDQLRNEQLDAIHDDTFEQLDVDAYGYDIHSFCYQYLMKNKSDFI